jgi:hypothetical protein
MNDSTAQFRVAVGLADGTVELSPPTPCQCCGQFVSTRPRHGALRFPHRCPHGRDCAAGDPRLGAHLDGRGTCPECNTARLAERMADAD